MIRPVLLLAWLVAAAAADLVPDPGPSEAFRSTRYAVTVRTAGGGHVDSFVYESRNSADFALFPRKTFMAKANHWTSWSADEAVTVVVEKLGAKEISTCVVRPKRLGITPTIAGNTARFVLPGPCQVSVEIDQDDAWINHPLLLFANPAERDVPDPASPDVWDFSVRGPPPAGCRDPIVLYFPRGVHHLVRDHGIPLRTGLRLRSGDRVHLAPGAYVVGAFRSDRSARNIVLGGRGTISGLGEPFVKSKYRPLDKDAASVFDYHRCAEHLVKLEGSGHRVEGLVFTDPPHFNLNVGDACRVDRVKCFGWHYSTDGIGLGDRSVVRDCFLKVNDDAFKLYNDGIDIAGCVVWQQFNGGVFQLSWGRMRVERGLAVRDIDIIHDEHHTDANNRGLFSCVELKRSVMRGLLFEDIRIEGDTFRLFDLRVQAGGSIEDLTFRRVRLEGAITDASYLRARGGTFAGIRFEECRVGGRPVRAPEDLKLRTEGIVPPPVFR